MLAAQILIGSYVLTFVLHIAYGLFEKLVHAVDNNELTEKDANKILWFASFVIMIGICVFMYKIR